jgi:methylated-DNA-[protein]-cysteine S-methyltransferase
MTSFALFGTPIGTCGIAWSERGISRVLFPEADEARTRRLLVRTSGAEEGEPPPPIKAVIDDIGALLAGESRAFADAALDYGAAEPFEVAVYELTRTIPPGRTLTYGEVAARAGGEGDARAVGAALGRNPVPIVVPCHRVIASDGRMHGFSGRGGIATKLKLLEIEGWRPDEGPTLFDGLPGFGLAVRR